MSSVSRARLRRSWPSTAWKASGPSTGGSAKERSQQAIADMTAGLIRQGQADGSIRDGHPVAMARALLLSTHGFVLSAHTMVDDEVGEEALDAELAHVVRRSVAP